MMNRIFNSYIRLHKEDVKGEVYEFDVKIYSPIPAWRAETNEQLTAFRLNLQKIAA